MKNYTYKELKEDLFNSLKKVNETDDVSFLSKGLSKKEITLDISKFMMFIEEVEHKKKVNGEKIKDYKEQLLIIKKYIQELDNFWD